VEKLIFRFLGFSWLLLGVLFSGHIEVLPQAFLYSLSFIPAGICFSLSFHQNLFGIKLYLSTILPMATMVFVESIIFGSWAPPFVGFITILIMLIPIILHIEHQRRQQTMERLLETLVLAGKDNGEY
jgi:hypothetical protein